MPLAFPQGCRHEKTVDALVFPMNVNIFQNNWYYHSDAVCKISRLATHFLGHKFWSLDFSAPLELWWLSGSLGEFHAEWQGLGLAQWSLSPRKKKDKRYMANSLEWRFHWSCWCSLSNTPISNLTEDEVNTTEHFCNPTSAHFIIIIPLYHHQYSMLMLLAEDFYCRGVYYRAYSLINVFRKQLEQRASSARRHSKRGSRNT